MKKHFIVKGNVIGVGFRSLVRRIALECGIKGFVKNLSNEVEVHAEAHDLTQFLKRVNGIKSTSFIDANVEKITETKCECGKYDAFKVEY